MRPRLRTILFPAALSSLAFVAMAASGCSKKATASVGSATPSFLEIPVPRRVPASPQTVARGKAVYEANCIQCHGARGAGDGFGAPFLVPRPRDFTTAQ